MVSSPTCRRRVKPLSMWDWYHKCYRLIRFSEIKVKDIFATLTFNPLTPTAIQKLLEIIDRVRLYPSCSFATALDSDINQTTGSGGHLSMWKNRCMHATVCLLRAGQPRSAGDAAKLGQFVGKFSWVTGDPIGVKGLCYFSTALLPTWHA